MERGSISYYSPSNWDETNTHANSKSYPCSYTRADSQSYTRADPKSDSCSYTGSDPCSYTSTSIKPYNAGPCGPTNFARV